MALLHYFHFLINSSCVGSGLVHKCIAVPNDFVYIYCFTSIGADMATICKTTVTWWKTSKNMEVTLLVCTYSVYVMVFPLKHKVRVHGFHCFRS